MKQNTPLEFYKLAQSIQPLLENYLLDNILGPRIDSWKKYPYDFRYLDTLARIFDIQPKNSCTSVVPLMDNEEAEYRIAIAFNTSSNQRTVGDLKKSSRIITRGNS